MTISPGLQEAIAKLAKVTVQTGADPGKVLYALQEMVRFRNEVWPHLTPMQRYAFRLRLRHMREEWERGHADPGNAGAQ